MTTNEILTHVVSERVCTETQISLLPRPAARHPEVQLQGNALEIGYEGKGYEPSILDVPAINRPESRLLPGGHDGDFTVYPENLSESWGVFHQFRMPKESLSGTQGSKVVSFASPRDGHLFHVVDANPYYLKLTGSGVVQEYAKHGTKIGVFHAVGYEDVRGLSYKLLDDAEGRFALDALSATLTVKDGTRIQYAIQTSHTLHIEVQDAQLGVAVLPYTIRVIPVHTSSALAEVILTPEGSPTLSDGVTSKALAVETLRYETQAAQISTPYGACLDTFKPSFSYEIEGTVPSLTTWGLLKATLASDVTTETSSGVHETINLSKPKGYVSLYTQEAFVADTSMFPVHGVPTLMTVSDRAIHANQSISSVSTNMAMRSEEHFIAPQTLSILYRQVSYYRDI
jgi:hypothetical protein